MIKRCKICNRRLNTINPLSKDCGGDCLGCIENAEDKIIQEDIVCQ